MRTYPTKLTFQDIQRRNGCGIKWCCIMTPHLIFHPPPERPYARSTPAPGVLMEFPELARSCTDWSPIQGKRLCKNRGDRPLMFCENLVKMNMCPKGCREG